MVVTTILAGMLLVPGLPYLRAMWIVLVGAVVGGIGLALVGNIGTRTGLPTMVAMRGSFGTRGSHLPSAVNIVVLVGWSWVQALLAGMSMNYAVKATFGYSNLPLFTILCEALVVLIVLRGHVGIERMEVLVSVAMLLLSAVVFYKIFTEFDIGGLLTMPADEQRGMTTFLAFDIVVALGLSWYALAADFNRNAKSESGGIAGTIIGYVVATMVAMGLGATVSGLSIMAGQPQTFDPTVLLAGFGFGLPAAIVIFLSVLTTNVMTVYAAVMSYMNIRPQDGFWRPAAVIGVITIIGAMWTGILDRFQDFLLLIGTLFIPVFAVMLADYYVVKRGHYDAGEVMKGRDGAYWYFSGYNPSAWIAYLIGAGLALYWTQISPLSFGASIPAFVVTFLLYLAATAVFSHLSRRSPENTRDTAPTSGIRR